MCKRVDGDIFNQASLENIFFRSKSAMRWFYQKMYVVNIHFFGKTIIIPLQKANNHVTENTSTMYVFFVHDVGVTILLASILLHVSISIVYVCSILRLSHTFLIYFDILFVAMIIKMF
jgi:hypothetical protein